MGRNHRKSYQSVHRWIYKTQAAFFFNFLENIARKCVSSATCLLYCIPVDIVVWLISWWFHCVQQGCKFPTLRHAMQYTSRERNHKSSWDCARAQSKRITDVKHNSVTLTIISTDNWTIYCGVLDLVSVSNKKFQNKCNRHKYLTSAKQLPRVLLPSWSINVLFNFKEAPPFSTRPLVRGITHEWRLTYERNLMTSSFVTTKIRISVFSCDKSLVQNNSWTKTCSELHELHTGKFHIFFWPLIISILARPTSLIFLRCHVPCPRFKVIF